MCVRRSSSCRTKPGVPSFLIIAAAGLVCLEAGSVFAQSRREARLAYVRGPGTESCPDDTTLRAEVADRLGYDPFRNTAELTVRAKVERDKGALVADVALEDAGGRRQGQRRIRGSFALCEPLISALALAISIAIDPLGGAPAPAAPPPASPPPAPPPGADVAPPGIDLDFTAGGVSQVSTLPKPALGLALGARVSGQHFRLGVEAQATLAVTRAVTGGGRFDTARYGLAVICCWRQGWLSGCAAVHGGVLRASGQAFSPSRSTAAPYLAPGPRVELELPIAGPIALRSFAGVEVPLVRAKVTVGDETVWKSPWVAATFGSMLVWRHASADTP
jgi:hypothetical protein